MCILVCDGLTGLPDAVTAIWPQTVVQKLRDPPAAQQLPLRFQEGGRPWCGTLKPVYTAPTEAAALARLADFADTWETRYPAIVKLWENTWVGLFPVVPPRHPDGDLHDERDRKPQRSVPPVGQGDPEYDEKASRDPAPGSSGRIVATPGAPAADAARRSGPPCGAPLRRLGPCRDRGRPRKRASVRGGFCISTSYGSGARCSDGHQATTHYLRYLKSGAEPDRPAGRGGRGQGMTRGTPAPPPARARTPAPCETSICIHWGISRLGCCDHRDALVMSLPRPGDAQVGAAFRLIAPACTVAAFAVGRGRGCPMEGHEMALSLTPVCVRLCV